MFNLNLIEHFFPPPCTISLQRCITFLRYMFGQTYKPVLISPERAFCLPLGKLNTFQSMFHLSAQILFLVTVFVEVWKSLFLQCNKNHSLIKLENKEIQHI